MRPEAWACACRGRGRDRQATRADVRSPIAQSNAIAQRPVEGSKLPAALVGRLVRRRIVRCRPPEAPAPEHAL